MKTKEGEKAAEILRTLILRKAEEIKQSGSTPELHVSQSIIRMLWEYYPCSLLRLNNNGERYFEWMLFRITDSLNMEFTVVDAADRVVIPV